MIKEVQGLINEHYNWMKSQTSLKEIGDNVEITTPYLDRHNDFIQIYAYKENTDYILTDDGLTIGDLKISGFNFDSPKRKQLMTIILNGFGVNLVDNELQVKTNIKQYALKQHNLLQAILSINDMFFLASPYIKSLFIEEVEQWLTASEVRFTPHAYFSGKSHFNYLYDFIIPGFKDYPERFLKTINKPNVDSAKSLILSWLDTKETRTKKSEAVAILNDSQDSITENVFEAFDAYNIVAVPWSKKRDRLSYFQN